MLKSNTVIFLQAKLSDDDAYNFDCSTKEIEVKWTRWDLKERIYHAKKVDYKFGFVLKSLK